MNLAQCFVRFFSWSCLSFLSLCMLCVRCKAERREIFLIDYTSHLTPVGSIFLFSLVLYQKRSLFLCKILTRTHKYTRVHKLLSHSFFLFFSFSLPLLYVCVCASHSLSMLQNAFCPLTENIMSEVAIGIDQISARARDRTLKCFPTHVPLANAQKRAHKHTHTHTHTHKERKKERERQRQKITLNQRPVGHHVSRCFKVLLEQQRMHVCIYRTYKTHRKSRIKTNVISA